MSTVLPEPASWRAIQLIKARIEAIRRDAGYYTDIGLGAIVTDRRQLPESGSYAVIVAGDFLTTSTGNRTYSEDMNVSIEFGIWLGAGSTVDDAEREAHRARVDVIRALHRPLRGEPNGIRVTAAEDSFITDGPDGSSYLIAQVSARAGLSETFPPAN